MENERRKAIKSVAEKFKIPSARLQDLDRSAKKVEAAIVAFKKALFRTIYDFSDN